MGKEVEDFDGKEDGEEVGLEGEKGSCSPRIPGSYVLAELSASLKIKHAIRPSLSHHDDSSRTTDTAPIFVGAAAEALVLGLCPKRDLDLDIDLDVDPDLDLDLEPKPGSAFVEFPAGVVLYC